MVVEENQLRRLLFHSVEFLTFFKRVRGELNIELEPYLGFSAQLSDL